MVITGKLFRSMVISAANNLYGKREEANNLNVFPVPDGDTGTNMSLTMSTVSKAEENLPVGECAEKVASLMLRSARGNSGAILSLFFRGFGKALKDKEVCGSEELVAAFARGTAEAYRAVMKPTEGTILTVMRVASENVSEAYGEDNTLDIHILFEMFVKSAEQTLAQTPEMLPVLKQAGVVDAGGFGFVCVVKGMQDALEGRAVEPAEEVNETALVNEAANFADFDTDDIEFGYCTECIVDKNEQYIGEDTAGELYDFIKSIGDSAVFVDDENIIKLHIHTNDPGAVLTKAIGFGSLATVKIENMRNQHTALKSGAEHTSDASSAPRIKIDKKYGFVSVCMGDGIKNVFVDIGVDTVIEGGQTMNPSTQDIIDAVMKTPAEYVFVFPNNKNICMVARQAAEIVRERHVIVVPTETVAQGMSAMIAYNPDSEVDDIVSEMTHAMSMVTSMSVTYAVRDTEIDRFKISKGQFLGLVENKIACVTDTRDACMKQLIRGMTGASFVTVFYGENVSEEDASGIGELISQKVGGGCEVAVLAGGQPIYDYIISVE